MKRFLIDAIFACLGVLLCVGALYAHREGMIGDVPARMFFGIDRESTLPLSIQALTWIVFFIGLGELIARFTLMHYERHALRSGLLPPDNRDVLRLEDLGDLYRKANVIGAHLMFPRAVIRIVSSFQVSQSVAQCSTILQSSLDLLAHEIELRYNFLRYLLWLLPSLGFIGTVWGIGQGLDTIAQTPPTLENAQEVLGVVTSKLAIAFDTTLVALLLTSILAYLLHIAQTDEERIVNLVGQRCVDDLVNQLLEE